MMGQGYQGVRKDDIEELNYKTYNLSVSILLRVFVNKKINGISIRRIKTQNIQSLRKYLMLIFNEKFADFCECMFKLLEIFYTKHTIFP